MKIFICLPLVWVILSCSARESQNIPSLTEKIDSFIQAKKCFRKQTEILIVNLAIKTDTLQLEFVDTYPYIHKMKFQFDTIISGVRVIFTSEKIKGFSKEKQEHNFPIDIVSLAETNPDLFYGDYTSWVYLFRRGELIYSERPCAERK